MTELEKETERALKNPKRGTTFSEMLAYWVCVIKADETGITCLEGTTGNWRITRYADADQLERRFRYNGRREHWITLHEDRPESAEHFENIYINHFREEDRRRDARLELILD